MHFRVDVARARAFVQQIGQQIGGQVIGVGHLLRREIVGKVPVAAPPSLKRNAVFAGSFQALLNGFVGQVRQLMQFLNQTRPAAFAHADDRDTRIENVMQFVIVVWVKARYAGSRKGPGGSPADDRDLP